MGPELGRTQFQRFLGDHPQPLHLHMQSPHPYLHLQPHPHPYHPPSPLPYANGIEETIRREIEKEQIRAEIIMSDIMRRHDLEAEVRRELMIERELALRRGRDGIAFGSPSVTGFDLPLRPLLVESRVEDRSLEERIISSLADGERLNGRQGSGGHEPLPFQRGATDVRFSEAKAVSERAKDKPKIILLAKPSEKISGVKREASESGASESPSDGLLIKRAKEKWSCALCQVSTTCEQALNDHVQGKKHRRRDAALRAQKGEKNYSIGLFPKKAAKTILKIDVNPSTENQVEFTAESLPFNEIGDASPKGGKNYITELNPKEAAKMWTTQVPETDLVTTEPLPFNETGDASEKDELLLLQLNQNGYSSMKNEVSLVAENVQKGNVPKKLKYKHMCKLCLVGCQSRKVLNNHMKGRKHKRRLVMSRQNFGFGGPSDERGGPADEKFAGNGGAMDEPQKEVAIGVVLAARNELREETMAEDGRAVQERLEEETAAEDGVL